MSDGKPTFGVSVVSSDVDASVGFYRALGVDIPDDANWRSHHVGIPIEGSALDLDSVELTKAYDDKWNGTAVILIMTTSRPGSASSAADCGNSDAV